MMPWIQRYHQLVAYKKANGDCNVPHRYTENPVLGKWVGIQRAMLQKKTISEDRICKLNNIGFTWEVRAPTLPWIQRYHQLVAYKKANGDCNVPHRYTENPVLGYWVSRQRFLKNKKGMEDRIKKLNAIGFKWRMQVAKEPHKKGKVKQKPKARSLPEGLTCTLPGRLATKERYTPKVVEEGKNQDACCKSQSEEGEPFSPCRQRKAAAKKESKPLFDGESLDWCYVCDDGGDLLCCDYCEKAFHLSCHIPPLGDIPKGDWKCCNCAAVEYKRNMNCGECEADINPESLTVGSCVHALYRNVPYEATIIKRREKGGKLDFQVYYTGDKKTRHHWVTLAKITNVISTAAAEEASPPPPLSPLLPIPPLPPPSKFYEENLPHAFNSDSDSVNPNAANNIDTIEAESSDKNSNSPERPNKRKSSTANKTTASAREGGDRRGGDDNNNNNANNSTNSNSMQAQVEALALELRLSVVENKKVAMHLSAQVEALALRLSVVEKENEALRLSAAINNNNANNSTNSNSMLSVVENEKVALRLSAAENAIMSIDMNGRRVKKERKMVEKERKMVEKKERKMAERELKNNAARMNKFEMDSADRINNLEMDTADRIQEINYKIARIKNSEEDIIKVFQEHHQQQQKTNRMVQQQGRALYEWMQQYGSQK